MTMPSEPPALVDANVLVYAFHQDSDHYEASRNLLEQSQDGMHALCVTPQVLAEFYAVVTDSRRVAVAKQPDEALQAVADLLAMPGLTLLGMPAEIVSHWIELVRRRPVTRGAIFDVQLVATMLANGIKRIYTFDRSDFEQFTEIEVLVP